MMRSLAVTAAKSLRCLLMTAFSFTRYSTGVRPAAPPSIAVFKLGVGMR